jgi:hypothetical protein
MKVIVSRAINGKFAEVGTSDRMLISDLKTERGVIRRARQFAQGKSFRLEYFYSEHLYGNPFRVTVHVR